MSSPPFSQDIVTHLRIASDLHFEFYSKPERWDNGVLVYPTIGDRFNEALPPLDTDSKSCLILAGDISCLPTQLEYVLKFACDRFAFVFYIPGNHEHYGGSFERWSNFVDHELSNKARYPNLHVVKADEVNRIELREDVTLIGGTMWSDALNAPFHAQSRFNDFRQIAGWGPEQCSAEFHRQSAQIEDYLKQAKAENKRAVVVTHHLPSFSLCDFRYSPDVLDPFYASNLNHLLAGPTHPEIWIHGHTHVFQESLCGDTFCVSNPRGYPGETTYYRDDYVIDLDEDAGAATIET